MKKAILSLCAVSMLIMPFSVFSGDCNNKDRLKKKAERYKKEAEHLRSASINKCDEKSSDAVKKVAQKIIDKKKQLASVLDKLAAAYESGNTDNVDAIYAEKTSAYRQISLLDKEKRIERSLADVDRYLEKYPDSMELKALKKKIKNQGRRYISLMKKIADAQDKADQMELEMRKVSGQVCDAGKKARESAKSSSCKSKKKKTCSSKKKSSCDKKRTVTTTDDWDGKKE